MRDTPETNRIMDNIQISFTSDTREQSLAHKEEARREIENLERERNALLETKRELLEALEYMVEVGVEFYDMECGQVGGGAIEQAQTAIEKAKGDKDE